MVKLEYSADVLLTDGIHEVTGTITVKNEEIKKIELDGNVKTDDLWKVSFRRAFDGKKTKVYFKRKENLFQFLEKKFMNNDPCLTGGDKHEITIEYIQTADEE